MILGAITNTWRDQLSTTGLSQLVERAKRRGAVHIELRQTCLGVFEYGAGEDWRPDAGGLTRLVRTFPLMTFNLAIAYPCISQMPEPDSGVFQSCLDAALQMVGSAAPSLRLVDPARFDTPWGKLEDIPQSALGVKDLTEAAAARGVRLSIENSNQPVRSMGLLVNAVRDSLPVEHVDYLGLCLDPINSLKADPLSDPIAEIQALPLDQIFMVHFKQTLGGSPHPTVSDGDLDFARLTQMLRIKNYRGPVILEIPPAEEAFENFGKSMKYLQSLMETG